MKAATVPTLGRAFSPPIFFLLWFSEWYLVAMGFLAAALLTDMMDEGTILDPIADKIVILSLAAFLYRSDALDWWYAVILIARSGWQLGQVAYFKWIKPKELVVSIEMIPRLATRLAFLVLWLAFLRLVPVDAFGTTWDNVVEKLLGPLAVLSALFEVFVLARYSAMTEVV